MRRISLLKMLHDAQRVQVVIEVPSMPLQTAIQSTLACVTERRMPDIVHQRQCFSQILVQPERTCSCPRNLRDLNRVRKPTAKMI
jgi:hypothetical protein